MCLEAAPTICAHAFFARRTSCRNNGLEAPGRRHLSGGDEEDSMRLDDLPQSENIEDRRGADSSGGGGGFGFPMGRGGLGIGTIAILGIIGYALGIDPRLLIGGAEIFSGGAAQKQKRPQPAGKNGAPRGEMGEMFYSVL